MLRSSWFGLLLVLPACFNPPSPADDTANASSTGPITDEPPGTTADEPPGTTTDEPPGTTTAVADTGSTTDEPPGTTTAVADTGSTGSPDPCADMPCINGTCTDVGGAAVCTCDEGWAGDLCDTCDEGYVLLDGMCVAEASCAANPCGAGAICDDTGVMLSCSHTFGLTGADQPWQVPAGIMEIDVTALGAAGGCALGGLGGQAIATVPVTPGEMLHVRVGGMGACGVQASLPGGYNGGGNKFTDAGDSWEGGSGGGGTDLRRGGVTLNHRVIVAGGGGGQGWGGQAGDGGGELGETCNGIGGGCVDETCGGRGGTQVAGGIGGFCYDGCEGMQGTLGQGGTSDGCAAAGGGGGGGYYGGGGGAHCSGGGGSSRVNFPGNTNTSTTAGLNPGDGELTIVWHP